MNTFYTKEELNQIGIKRVGDNVLIGRNALIYNPEKLTIGNNVRIDDFCILSGNIDLHDYIHLSHFCGLYGGEDGIIMEDFTVLASKCSVYAVSDDYSGRSLTNPMIPMKYKPGMISKQVVINKHSIIGASSIILPGITISEGCALGAMSLCTKSTEPWKVYVGSPCKKIKERERDILKLEKEFLNDLKS